MTAIKAVHDFLKYRYSLVLLSVAISFLIADLIHFAPKKINLFYLGIIIFIILYVVWFRTIHVSNENNERRLFGITINNSVLFFLGIIIIKLLFQIILYKSGFISVSADEFARGITAFQWSKSPHFIYLAEAGWMPLETYMNGLVMMIWDNVILAPRLTAFLASCLLIVWLYKLTRYVFAEQLTAYFSVLMLLFHQWFVWLSGTPMLDIYFLAFISGGIYYLAVWLKEGRKGYLWISALFFIVSSGFHFQSWAVINIINLVSCFSIMQFLRTKTFHKAVKLIVFYFLNNSFIFIYILATYHKQGTINVFSFHTEWTKLMRGGYDIPLINKMLYYPLLVFKNGLTVWWLLFIVALSYLIFKKREKTQLTLFSVLPIWLGTVSLFNVWSVPGLAAPGRFSLFFFILSMPFVAYGFNLLFQWNDNAIIQQNLNYRNQLRFLSLFVIGLILLINISRSLTFPKPLAAASDTIQTGKFMNDLLRTETTLAHPVFMVESLEWSFLGIQLTSKHPQRMILDRRRNIWDMNRRVPSMFEVEDSVNIKKYLITNNVRYIVLRSDGLKRLLDSHNYIFKVKDLGTWTIFKVYKDPI